MSDERTGATGNEQGKDAVFQIGDQGAAGPFASANDDEPESALGGGTATRSSTAEGEDPAEE